MKLVRTSLYLLALALAGAPLCLAQGAQAKAASLRVASQPVLVDCAPVTQSPCLSASFVPVDANGQPAPVVLPAPAELAHSITLTGADRTVSPFYATAGSGPDAEQHSNVVLLLIDISGSMNQPAPGSPSRFAAVKEAVTKYLADMQEGTDRIAIVPFQSHDVVSTIRSAVYVNNKADALAQLRALPEPASKNNTALYQAVFSGIDSLKQEVSSLGREGHSVAELQPHLLVMTDGKNEVFPGDDPQLLNGDLGLQQAAAQVQASHLDVVGIGFGDRTSIDAAAMQRLSSRFLYAADAAQLLAALHTSRTAASHTVQMVWLLPDANRLALTGHDETVVPSLRLADGSTLQGGDLRWIAPAIGAPTYTRRALATELQALIQSHPVVDSGWASVVVYSLLFLAASAVVLVLWFWVPRLVWGDRYSGSIPQPAKRWSGDKGGMTSAAAVQVRSSSVPAGFDPSLDSTAPIRRSASQITQVQPRGEFSRTRLT